MATRPDRRRPDAPRRCAPSGSCCARSARTDVDAGLPRLARTRRPSAGSARIPVPYTREDARDFVEDVAMRSGPPGPACRLRDRGRRRARRDRAAALPAPPAGSGPRSATASRRGPAGRGYAAEAARGLAEWALEPRARRGCTCSPTSPNTASQADRAAGGVHAGGRRARRAWSTGTAPGATRCCSGGWPATERCGRARRPRPPAGLRSCAATACGRVLARACAVRRRSGGRRSAG